jgi:monooxygenase
MNNIEVDLIVVGAGIQGISHGYYLKKHCPDKTFLIIERNSSCGGVWHEHRYPGVRSDHRMYTYGFSFNFWPHKEAFGTGEKIREYFKDTLDKFDINPHIKYNESVLEAKWDIDHWIITTTTNTYKCKFLVFATGSHYMAHRPNFVDSETFQGQIIHPRHWPDNVDYKNKKIIIIGSGATMVTLAPELAKTADVTVIQRSPGYIVNGELYDKHTKFLPKSLIRLKWILKDNWYVFKRTFFQKQFTEQLSKVIKDYDKPYYQAGDQRVGTTIDNDFFNQKFNIITSEIEKFTEKGIQLKSGNIIPADIIVTATGFDLEIFGKVEFTLNGTKLNYPKEEMIDYRGVMINQIPNLFYTSPFFGTAYTLRAELVSKFVCKLLRYMDKNDYKTCTPYSEKSTKTRYKPTRVAPGFIKRNGYKWPKFSKKSYSDFYLVDLFTPRITKDLRYDK